MAFYDKFLNIYDKVAIGWVKKSIKKPLLTLYSDSEQELLIDKTSIAELPLIVNSSAEFQKRMMFIQVRI